MHVARLLPLACLLGGAAGFVAPASCSAGRCPRALTVLSSTVDASTSTKRASVHHVVAVAAAVVAVFAVATN